MNTKDDPKSLPEGQVQLLTNATPGKPPVPREGNVANIVTDSANWLYRLPGIKFTDSSDDSFAYIWVKSGDDYIIKQVPSDTDGTDFVDIGTARFATIPILDFMVAHDSLYVISSVAMTQWEGETTDVLGHKVIESDGTTARDLTISAQAGVQEANQDDDDTNGPFVDGDFIEYGYTYVRMTDAGSFEAGTTPDGMILPPGITGKPQTVTAYLPGSVEGIETSSERHAISILAGVTGHLKFYMRHVPHNNTVALHQGATHMYIWRTRIQTSAVDAAGASKFFIMAIPLLVGEWPSSAGDIQVETPAADGDITPTKNFIDIQPSADGSFFLNLLSGALANGTVVFIRNNNATYGDLQYIENAGDDDIQLQDIASYPYAGAPFVKTAGAWYPLYYDDKVTDAAISGEINQLTMDNYTTAPYASFIEFVKERLWLFHAGKGYYSEQPGGDGGTTGLLAQTYPQKYSSMFNVGSMYVDCDSSDGEDSRGMVRLYDNLFFFKETKSYVLLGGDPSIATPDQISATIGCEFPNTITKAEVQGLFGNCIFFMSNRGPVVIDESARLRPLSEFKIKELWDGRSWDNTLSELYADIALDADHIRNHCSAAWFKDTWYVYYVTSTGSFKVFGMYFDPEIATDSVNASIGAWQMVIAVDSTFDVTIVKPYHLVKMSERSALAFGECDGTQNTEMSVTDFLGNATYQDEIS